MTAPLFGFLLPWLITAAITLLHVVLPGRVVEGYVTDAAGRPLRYRLNGLRVLLAAVGLWGAAGACGLMAWDLLYLQRWWSLLGACVLGLLFTAGILWGAPATSRGLATDLFLGRRENPQWRRIDAKMWLYLVGAVLLALNLLSAAAHHWLLFPDDPNPGVLLHLVLFGWFLCEYLYFERVHLYTWDFIAEGVGFKLGWGCLVFYPYFYGVGLWSLAERADPQRAGGWLFAAALVFFAGWALARGANMQKYSFKRDPDAVFLGLIPPVVVSDGQRALLVSGFWGLSRHINYLGELLMAVGLVLALGWPGEPGPWLYPLYYVALLVPRQLADDRRCAAKYGPLWDAYVARVRWRIVPGVY